MFLTTVCLGSVNYGINSPHRFQDITNHFNSVISINNARMIKNNVISINSRFDILSSLGYGYYIPTNDENAKRFYFFITNVDYINDKTTNITISIDWFATDFNNITLTNSYISRIHPTSFNSEYNNLAESVSFGEEKTTLLNSININFNNCYIIGVTHEIPITRISDSAINEVLLYAVGNVFKCVNRNTKLCGSLNGVMYYVLNNISDVVNVYCNAIDLGYTSSIVGVWSVPDFFLNSNFTTNYTVGVSIWGIKPTNIVQEILFQSTDDVKILNNSNSILPIPNLTTHTFTRPTTIDGYTPTYQKCFDNQFIKPCVYVNNQCLLLNYELFPDINQISGGNFTFNLYASVEPNSKMYIVPYGYNHGGNYDDFQNAISFNITLSGNLTSDNTTNAINNLMFNGVLDGINTFLDARQKFSDNLDTALGNDDINSPTDIATLTADVVSASEGAYGTIFNDMVKNGVNMVKNAREIGKTNSRLITSGNTSDFATLPDTSKVIHFGYVSFRNDDILRVDKYFSRFGYRVENFLIPTLRDTYTYVQGDVNFYGNISSISREYIKNLFNNGVTIWNNSNMYDYDV